MNFKRIEMYGFKSFAEKIEIKFEKGITGIVGPNGCGKSNVADAVRWVLGEQSAKTLRGSNMMDVIFSGTEKRKSLSFCEVSLVFDNDDHILPIEFTEVVISRKLYRSGDSEYAINKTPCRLKDVVDLLRDIGIGKEGYSIIGQGKIDEVLSSKPDERRGIFEEACGISKFKARKAETERKLARTQENLVRINDIVVEIERQIEPLSKQSEDARKYLDFKENLKYHEINYYIYQYDSSNHFKNQILTKLDAINEEYNLKKSEYDKANESYNQCLVSIDNIDSDISNLRDKQLELQVGLEKSSGEAKLTLERIRNLKANNEKMLADIKFYDETGKAAKSKFDGTKAAIDKNNKELEQLLNTETRLADEYLEIVAKINKIENEDIDNEKQVLDSLIKLSDIKSDISGLSAEKKAHMEKCAEINKDKEALEKELVELNKQINESQEKIKEFLKNNSELNALKKKTLEDIKNNSELLSENNSEIKKFENYYASICSKEKMLIRLQDSFEGYQYSVRSLLTAAKTDVEISSKICGTVASLMTVPKDYEIAIDVALGQTLQNIIVNHQSDAKVLIGYLKRQSLGRVTFLPVDTIKGYNDNYKHFSKIEGFLGIASDLISFDRKYQNIYTGLLNRTAIVDSYDNAISMARQINYQVKIVTLDGEIIHPFGSITGGSRKSESSSLLSLEREISEVKQDIINIKNKLDGHNRKIIELEEKKIKCETNIEEIKQNLHDIDLRAAVEKEKLNKLSAQNAEKTQELGELSNLSVNLTEKIGQISDKIAIINNQKSDFEGDNVDEIMQKKHGKTFEFRKQRDEILNKQTEIKVKIAQCNSELKSLNSEIERLSFEIESIELNRQKTQEFVDENLEQINFEHDIKVYDISDSESKKLLNEVLEKLSNLDRYKQDVQTNLRRADSLRMELSGKMQDISDKKYKEELNLSKIDTDLDIMKERILEEYQCDYNDALKYKAENFEHQKAPAEIAKLKRQIAALGYVNVNAIEDFSALKIRYDDLSNQRQDLVKAQDDLVKIISELTVEMIDRFTKGFSEINLNFQRVFKELFGGGNAKLILEEPQDGQSLLDTGIEIVAEPPEKKLKSVSLLSGGERALTAIAILFAILKLRPMPFCLLDEIEAALDDANVDRFARYLKKFSDTTQFIVITHRKPTMELADALFGVTMEEKGVSKIVSVKLSDVA